MSIKQELMEGQIICRSEQHTVIRLSLMQKFDSNGKIRNDQIKSKQRAGPCLLFVVTRKNSFLP